jgi:hypothetical protein
MERMCSTSKPHPKAKFNPAEDEMLSNLVKRHGTTDWTEISLRMEGRNARQCRDRWINYLSPSVENGPWTTADDQELLLLYHQLGAKWKYLATFFKGRTEINVKSRWNLIQRRLRRRAKAEQIALRFMGTPQPTHLVGVSVLRSEPPVESEEYYDSWNFFAADQDRALLGDADEFWS